MHLAHEFLFSGPRLVKYIATNRTIEGNWYVAVVSDIPRPYALWLYSLRSLDYFFLNSFLT